MTLETKKEMVMYTITDQEFNDLRNRFTYHSPKNDQPARYNDLGERAGELAVLIMTNVPPSRERALALTNLEQAIMWANAGIARNE